MKQGLHFRNRVILAMSATACAVLSLSGCGATSSPLPAETVDLSSTYDGPRPGASLPGSPRDDREWSIYWNDLVNIASFYGIEDPQAGEVVRWILPEEAGQYRDPCVEEQGFQKDGVGWTVAPDQKSAFNRAMFLCFTMYPPEPRYIAPLTHDNLGAVYDWIAGTEIPCLESRGYSISGLPSRAVWVETYLTDPYYPYSELPEMGMDDLTELERACPQWPPSKVVYGQ